MRVSIIINNYNYGRYVGAAIESALGQSYPGKEVIVVDDGSTDGSMTVIRQYTSRGVKIVEKQNGGQASALNTGFAASSGDLVQFLDADDFLDSKCTATLVAAWEQDLAAIQYRLRLCDEKGALLAGERTMPRRVSLHGQLEQQLDMGFYYYTPTSGNIYSRSALAATLPIPEEEFRLCADTYVQTAMPFVGRIKVHPDLLGNYRVHGDNHFFSKNFSRDVKRLRWAVDSDLKRHRLIERLAKTRGMPVVGGLDRRWLPLLSRRLALRIHLPHDPLVAADTRLRMLGWAVRASPLFARREGFVTCGKFIFKMALLAILPIDWARRMLQKRNPQ